MKINKKVDILWLGPNTMFLIGCVMMEKESQVLNIF